MIESFGIYWAGINRIITLPFFILLIFFIIKNYKNIKKFVVILVHHKNKKPVLQNFSLPKYLIKSLCLICSLIFIFIALLQPQGSKKEQTIIQEGRDLLIVLDISRSMLAQDLKPNRLYFTKLKIRTLLNKLSFERIGLILFSGSSFIQCPLTVDYSTFLMFLDQIDVETIASGSTAIDTALAKAIEIFSNLPNRKNKLVLLATDGEDFSLNLTAIQKKAKSENIKIFTLGVGTPDGAPIPVINSHGNQSGHEVDENGHIVLSKLNEQLLQNICTDLNGNYIRTTYDDSDVDYIVKLINQFEKEKFTDKKLSMYEDQYPWFLGISWILLALEWIL